MLWEVFSMDSSFAQLSAEVNPTISNSKMIRKLYEDKNNEPQDCLLSFKVYS